MRNGQLLFSAIQFLMIIALFVVGMTFLGLHFLPNTRHVVVNWILNPNKSFLVFGSIVIVFAISLGICFWSMQKGSFVRISMKKGSFSMHEDFVKKAIQQFWQERFPEEEKPIEVFCAHQKIEIITKEQEQDLETLEEQLGEFLAKQFGYDKEYYIFFTTQK